MTRREKRILYICDPDKNTGCHKDCCMYNPYAAARWCCFTRNQEYAKMSKRGKPIKATWYREIRESEKVFPSWGLAAVSAITSALLTLLLTLSRS